MSRRTIPRKTRSRHPLLAWLLSGLLALVLVLVLGNQAYAQMQQASDVTAIEHVALTAIGASIRAVVVPHTQASYATAASPKTALKAAPADLALAQTQAHALFTSVYDAKCLPCQTEANKTLQTLQAEGKGTFRALAWAVRDIEWRQVLLNGQVASVTLAATLWSKVQYLDEFGKLHTVTPIGGEVMIYSLTKSGATWIITNQVQDDTAASNLPVNQQKPNGQNGPPPAGQPTPTKQEHP